MQTEIASRLEQVLGNEPLAETARKLAAEGCVVSPQAVHKWRRGNPIGEENLLCFCRAYGVEPAWLRYGVGPRSASEPKDSPREAAGELLESLPPDARQEALDFIEWKIQRSPFIDREQFGRYLRMIDRIKMSTPGKNNDPPPSQ